jgi:NAD(P)-dependent dehydrogenase (short-subunit alcohol dehydrogenase family)
MAGRLKDKVAVVTGAARGIGLAVATAYAQEGATVFGVDVLEKELGSAMKALAAEGRQAEALPADIAQESEVERVFDRIHGTHPCVDVLANVAGIIVLEPVERTTAEIWDRTLGVNLRGAFLCVRAVVPAMKQARRGSIISTSSNAGIVGYPNETAYCASKFGIEGLSRALTRELTPFGIAVNTITPGTPVQTEMSVIALNAEQKSRWQDPAVIAPAYVHLAMQDASGITDQYVDAWKMSETLRAQGWASCPSRDKGNR